MREACQRLAGLDNVIPCASWLPIISQNPTASALYWQDLQRPRGAGIFHGRRRWRSPLVKSCIAGGLVLGLRALGLLEPFELTAYDLLMQQRPAEPVDSRIVVVEVSAETTSD
ncbi:MAG: hypothetical protein HC800_22085 [Phormidesmis sp. RL_2_1]|nr:hypothetical protein [Phormidesmis sp. RL_2_1]